MLEIRQLPERRTLNGKFSAYCHVCWNAPYLGWIGDEDHGGVCPHGATKPEQCPDARSCADISANMAKLRKQGLIDCGLAGKPEGG